MTMVRDSLCVKNGAEQQFYNSYPNLDVSMSHQKPTEKDKWFHCMLNRYGPPPLPLSQWISC